MAFELLGARFRPPAGSVMKSEGTGPATVWIVSEPRPEHVAALAWLNESSSAAFYMVKVEAVKIGDSPAAALFTLIVGPSEEARSVGQT